MENRRTRESAAESTIRPLDNAPLSSTSQKKSQKKPQKKNVCSVCKRETRALRQCRDCGLVFCPLCLSRDYNAQGQVIQVYPECPKCRSENLRAC